MGGPLATNPVVLREMAKPFWAAAGEVVGGGEGEAGEEGNSKLPNTNDYVITQKVVTETLCDLCKLFIMSY